jgi:dTDP-4-dehydrorhamnose 3,5-epimerase-like enzyme
MAPRGLDDVRNFTDYLSDHYVPEAARGVRWDDPAFGIDCPRRRAV